MGEAPDPTWSTGSADGGGDPRSAVWAPAECDTTLQAEDRWFFGANVSLRSLSDLVRSYHLTVGRNCQLMVDLTPDRSGVIPPQHVARYKELGECVALHTFVYIDTYLCTVYIRTCVHTHTHM